MPAMMYAQRYCELNAQCRARGVKRWAEDPAGLRSNVVARLSPINTETL